MPFINSEKKTSSTFVFRRIDRLIINFFYYDRFNPEY